MGGCNSSRWQRHQQDNEEELRLSDRGFMALILDVLKDEAGNGYDVVKAFETRLGDQFQAGPGAIYPVLQLLEDAGYVKAEVVEDRKVFVVTDAGKAYLAERQEGLDGFWARVARAKYRDAVWDTLRDLKTFSWEFRSTVGERRLETDQLSAIRAAIAAAREVIERNLAG